MGTDTTFVTHTCILKKYLEVYYIFPTPINTKTLQEPTPCEGDILKISDFLKTATLVLLTKKVTGEGRDIAFFTLDAGLLARSQYSEGPATGHFDTGFS